MKQLLVIISLLLLGEYTIAQTAREEKNKKTVLASYHAMEKGDMENAFKHFDKEIMFSGNGGQKPGKVTVENLKTDAAANKAEWQKAFPDVKNELIAAAASGDYVMLYTTASGTWKDNFSFWQPSGKSYKVVDVMVYKLNKAGNIVSVQNILPNNAVLDQVNTGAEFELNNAGYALLGQEKFDDAIEVFKLNVKLYPKSGNVYDSLGEAYLLAGNKDKAIENYEKSVKLDPNNTNGIEVLKKLRN
jgi:tetratricopeptide (TPR) repeat protein